MSSLLSGFFFYNRAIARRESARLSRAMSARDTAADRARAIEQELGGARQRLAEMETSGRAQSAEIQALRSLGAHAVGMSTVAEASAAHAAGLRVVGLSCIANLCKLAPLSLHERLRDYSFLKLFDGPFAKVKELRWDCSCL